MTLLTSEGCRRQALSGGEALPTAPHLPGRQEQLQNWAPFWESLLDCTHFRWYRAWEVGWPELPELPTPKLVQFPPRRSYAQERMGPACSHLTESSPTGSVWGPVDCCQKGFVDWAMIVNRNRLKGT